jgi:hypothetical protein
MVYRNVDYTVERAENSKKGRGEVSISLISDRKRNLMGIAAQKWLGGYQASPQARRGYSARSYALLRAFPTRFCFPKKENVEKFLTFGTQKHEPQNIKIGENTIKNAIIAIKKEKIATFSSGSCFWVPFSSAIRVFGCRFHRRFVFLDAIIRVFGCRFHRRFVFLDAVIRVFECPRGSRIMRAHA